MKNKNAASMLLGLLSLISLPMLSHANSCSEIKDEYWNCVRASMNNEACESDVSIPPECLKSVTDTIKNYNASESNPNFFGKPKESKPFVYQADLPPKKPVKVINVKPAHGVYLETEEDVNQYITKIKEELSEAITDGKRVRLQFQ
jgi:hypothetical protein